MKKSSFKFKTILISLIAAMIMLGCYGKNAVFNKVHKWNGTIQNKFARSLVHFAFWVVPVYEVSFFIDIVVLNVIEFWTGTNPVAMNEGDREEQIVEKNGVRYKVVATKNRFDIFPLGSETASKTSLIFHPSEKAWYAESKDGKRKIIAEDQFDENSLTIYMKDGTAMKYNHESLISN